MILRYLRKLLNRNRLVQTPSTANFSTREFRCHDGTDVPERFYADTQLLMEQLEVLREHFGKPIHIMSGYRSPAHNRRKGGRKKSRHLRGQAADIQVDGVDPGDVADAIAQLIAAGRMEQGGLGRYPRFTHYDVRGHRARWG